jgi:WD40 repeat protein
MQNFSPNGKFLVSSSSSERYASVWDLESSSEAAAGT